MRRTVVHLWPGGQCQPHKILLRAIILVKLAIAYHSCYTGSMVSDMLADTQTRTHATQSTPIYIVNLFADYIQLTYDFQPFPRKDQNLPLNLLPPEWQGQEARRIFRELRTVFNEGLPAFMTGVLSLK